MAVDVAPALVEGVQKAFDEGVARDPTIASILMRIRDGTPRATDSHRYAERLGEILAASYKKVIREDDLPNGRMYYNIANRIIKPPLRTNYDMVMEASEDIQKAIDVSDGLGIGTIAPDFPEARVDGLIDKLSDPENDFVRIIYWLGEPIVNNTEAFADDFVRANADLRSKMGLTETITRISAPGCCEWCDAMAGSYEYGDHPREIFQRHEYCRCTVTHQTSKGERINVWSKKTWAASPEELERRRTAGAQDRMTARERQEVADRIERDRVIADFMRRTGYTRETASESTRNKSPAEIEKEIQKIINRRKSIMRR
jgi:hypothetical protein